MMILISTGEACVLWPFDMKRTYRCVCVCVCAQAGANMIVSGSAIMRSTDPRHAMSMMRNAVVDAIHKQLHIITAS